MLISVIIPCYNHQEYIGEAIESILKQTHERLELIVIDDGSRDNSCQVIGRFADPRLRFFEQSNAGAHATINRALAMAQGDMLAILNSDDVFHPERLSRCLDAMDRDGTDIACSWIEVIGSEGQPLGIKRGWNTMRPSWTAKEKNGVWQSDSFEANLLSSNFISTTSNLIFSRRLYNDIGGMKNLRFAHDWDFALRCAAKYKFSHVESPLLKYRIHSSNTINSNREWMLFETCWIMAKYFNDFSGFIFNQKNDQGADLAEKLKRACSSYHVYGCGRALWMLVNFISHQRLSMGADAGDVLLDDAEARSVFVELIKTELASHASH
jgi:glycosyltransferase involved in cell wall biosynthesis